MSSYPVFEDLNSSSGSLPAHILMNQIFWALRDTIPKGHVVGAHSQKLIWTKPWKHNFQHGPLWLNTCSFGFWPRIETTNLGNRKWLSDCRLRWIFLVYSPLFNSHSSLKINDWKRILSFWGNFRLMFIKPMVVQCIYIMQDFTL